MTLSPPGADQRFLTQATRPAHAQRMRDGVWQSHDDLLVVEEPLQIRVGVRDFTATMRTPGHDFELARGLLFTEGVIGSLGDIARMRYCDTGDADEQNVLLVDLIHSRIEARRWQRNIISNSSCGLCGKATVEALRANLAELPPSPPIESHILLELPNRLRELQALFGTTGGTHAAGLFTAQGEALAVFEDIGRHNATDKVVGFALSRGLLPAADGCTLVLLVSGRASFEIVQKALRARIAIVAAVSAVSALAAELAAAHGQTLVGFVRANGHSVYAGPERIRGCGIA